MYPYLPRFKIAVAPVIFSPQKNLGEKQRHVVSLYIVYPNAQSILEGAIDAGVA
ncbi:hypothetical protein SBDP1_520070 [Syntrophobacter sp. SbD1]|nr:hypothetical protein SBDP1_520070 [Syntrophobacter sp. SbD1]